MSKSATSGNRQHAVDGPPDLHTQYESLLDQVWKCEAEWRLCDRIDAFCASQPDHCGVARRAR